MRDAAPDTSNKSPLDGSLGPAKPLVIKAFTNAWDPRSVSVTSFVRETAASVDPSGNELARIASNPVSACWQQKEKVLLSFILACMRPANHLLGSTSYNYNVTDLGKHRMFKNNAWVARIDAESKSLEVGH